MTYQISLVGFVKVRTPDGRNITPRAQKARGLVAMLALAPDFCRSRRWLEAHLWSDRAEPQAQGSLRQVLCETRRAFGADKELISADRERVWLDAKEFSVDLIHNCEDVIARKMAGVELMEGLLIRDEAFEDWLRMERSSFASLETDPKTQRTIAEPRANVSAKVIGRIKRLDGNTLTENALVQIYAELLSSLAGALSEEI